MPQFDDVTKEDMALKDQPSGQILQMDTLYEMMATEILNNMK